MNELTIQKKKFSVINFFNIKLSIFLCITALKTLLLVLFALKTRIKELKINNQVVILENISD